METIIEIYDKEPIYNILALTYMRPDTVIFIGGSSIRDREAQKRIYRYAQLHQLRTDIFFYEADFEKKESLWKLLDQLLDDNIKAKIHITGGEGRAIFLLGMYCALHPAEVFAYSEKEGHFYLVEDRESITFDKYPFIPMTPGLCVEDFLVMAGGAFIRHGHFSPAQADQMMLQLTEQIWQMILTDPERWGEQAAYFQGVNAQNTGNHLEVTMPIRMKGGNGKKIKCQMGLMSQLERAGAIKNFQTDRQKVHFSYKNETIRLSLSDIGIWLEIYIYKLAKESDFFDDVEISVVVDWNGDESEWINTVNEIDVIMTKRTRALFVSCKTGLPNTASLNEIHTLTQRFGGGRGVPVLVSMADVSGLAPSTYRRAADLGVLLLEQQDLRTGKLLDVLKKRISRPE